ncbi:MAG: opacity protein-like surface antigen [Polaribacter sp.]|jgi:opacity protein-like surface antigen
MNFKKHLILLLFLPAFLSAQHSEIGLMVGGSLYRGDLTQSGSFASFRETHVALGGFYRYNMNGYIAIKLGVNHGSISGYDSKSNDQIQQNRNLSFKSTVTEVALTGEFNILGFQPYGLYRPFSPYVFGGIAAFKYNPKTKLDGDWVALQKLGTEGVDYKLFQFGIPLGLGAKYALNDTWNIGLEAGARLTFTDYLDDVSSAFLDENTLLQNGGELAVALGNRSTGDDAFQIGDAGGNPDKKDMYFMVGLTISYNFLDNGLVGFRNRFRGSRNGCRTK